MKNVGEVLGYTQQDDGSFKAIIQPKGYIYTRAFILCRECGTAISAHGGPRYNSVCPHCYETVEGIHDHVE